MNEMARLKTGFEKMLDQIAEDVEKECLVIHITNNAKRPFIAKLDKEKLKPRLAKCIYEYLAECVFLKK